MSPAASGAMTHQRRSLVASSRTAAPMAMKANSIPSERVIPPPPTCHIQLRGMIAHAKVATAAVAGATQPRTMK